MATIASLANDSFLSQCADFVEKMLHRYLKTESEKPTPPTPAELQPAVTTLWRLSTIRKNLVHSPKPKKSSPTLNQANNPFTAQTDSPASHPLPPSTSSFCNSDSATGNSPSLDSVSYMAMCEHSSGASYRKSPFNIPTSPNPSPPAATASPPKFRYPPPQRTTV